MNEEELLKWLQVKQNEIDKKFREVWDFFTKNKNLTPEEFDVWKRTANRIQSASLELRNAEYCMNHKEKEQ